VNDFVDFNGQAILLPVEIAGGSIVLLQGARAAEHRPQMIQAYLRNDLP
jgi:hypothetical protein